MIFNEKKQGRDSQKNKFYFKPNKKQKQQQNCIIVTYTHTQKKNSQNRHKLMFS